MAFSQAGGAIAFFNGATGLVISGTSFAGNTAGDWGTVSGLPDPRNIFPAPSSELRTGLSLVGQG